METKIIEFCRSFYAATFIPISYFKNKKPQNFSYITNLQTLNLSDYFIQKLRSQTKNPSYYITQSFCYFGIVKLSSIHDFILIGPLFSTPITENFLKDFLNECTNHLSKEKFVVQFLQRIPLVSFNQFLNILAFIHLNINNEPINITEHFEINSPLNYENITTKHSNRIYNAKEDMIFHNTYYFEKHYLNLIKNGETDTLKKLLLKAGPSLKEGTVSENALRQRKNIFISCITLSTRSAIAGGLDMEQAYHLSDVYINECEKLQSVDSISHLQYSMVIDFAERVAKTKLPSNISKEVFECIQYINRNTNTVIRVNDIALHINRSRSYISKKFKFEVGMDLAAYIVHCKLEESKNLLSYSDKSLVEISNYLCFSSQAYFQNVFKRKYGLTPNQFRNQTIL